MESLNHQTRLGKADINSFEKYIRHLLIILRHLRIWRKDDLLETRKTLFRTILISFLLSANFWLIITEVLSLAGIVSLEMIANTVANLGFHISGFLKWSFCMKKHRQIAIIVARMNKCHLLCLSINNKEEDHGKYEEKMLKASYNSNLFIYAWAWICIYGVIHWCFNPLIAKFFLQDSKSRIFNETPIVTKQLPFPAWHPWDTDNFYGYLGSYTIQFIGGLSAGVGIMAYDVLYVTILIIISAQFQYLNASLSDEEYPTSRLDTRTVNLEARLKRCVLCHSEILMFLYYLEILVSPVMFVQCVYTLIVICLLSLEASSLAITMDTEGMIKLWSIVEYFSAIAMQLYFFCYYSTNIKIMSSQVADSIYCCGWESSLNEKEETTIVKQQFRLRRIKDVMNVMIMRAQKPVIMTGGPFYELSLETFKAIIGMALSNSMVLRQVSQGN
ncbi:hypothetical protein KM043_002242 [Ampulex compressa]|nr:hypothetical protein KM043_002242 [Ampulex compressa]